MICVSPAHIDDFPAALESGAAMLELRFDLLGASPAELFPRISGEMKSIATHRPGQIKAFERMNILKEAISLGADFVDIEIESPPEEIADLADFTREHHKQLIISYHNFTGTPSQEELESIMISGFEQGADLVKIATTVNTRGDLQILTGLFRFPGRKVILGMGEYGKILRVAAPYLGSEFTFASVREGGESAPGQLTIKQLQDIYKQLGEI